MFDRPGLILIISLFVLAPLSAHAGMMWLNDWEKPVSVDVIFFILVELTADLSTVLILSTYLAWLHDEYKRLNEPSPVRTEIKAEPRQIPNLNKPIYEQATPLVKVDVMGTKIKRCCRTLINQRESKFKIDLREETWIGQFGGRDAFVYFRDVIMGEAFAKKDPARKNSPFVVVDWSTVERGANGLLKH